MVLKCKFRSLTFNSLKVDFKYILVQISNTKYHSVKYAINQKFSLIKISNKNIIILTNDQKGPKVIKNHEDSKKAIIYIYIPFLSGLLCVWEENITVCASLSLYYPSRQGVNLTLVRTLATHYAVPGVVIKLKFHISMRKYITSLDG